LHQIAGQLCRSELRLKGKLNILGA
jgi:hypothetical protein